ncbi:unnamed protein product, partial [Choristocarpus tenellus]
NFNTDPWTRHALQFKGVSTPALCVFCEEGRSTNVGVLTVAKSGACIESLRMCTMVRSLGYVGSFLKEYSSAALLLTGALRNQALLEVVARPGDNKNVVGTFIQTPSAVGNGSSSCGTIHLDTAKTPANESQKAALLALSGSLDIIIGPPGTGKSTTIWHILNTKVKEDARVIVTCTRNQAIDAVVGKVSSFGVLVSYSSLIS